MLGNGCVLLQKSEANDEAFVEAKLYRIPHVSKGLLIGDRLVESRRFQIVSTANAQQNE